MTKQRDIVMNYEPEADVLSWEVSDAPIDSAREVGNLVVHFSKDQTPVLLEVLEAREFMERFRKVAARRTTATAAVGHRVRIQK